jgi:ABC-type glycerol-3-phosphate transport system permease component
MDNYVIAWNVLKRSLLNSFVMTLVVVVISIGISALSAYVFALFQFPGRDLLFWSFLSVLFIPGILTFATRYQVVEALGMVDTYAVQVLPYIAISQIFQIVVLRSFFAGLPLEVIESAQVDGAGIWRVFLQIVLPMSRPILATLAVMRAMGFWDEWLWPMVTVFKWELRPMALQIFYLTSDIGPHVGRQMAGYVLASIPLLILFTVASKQFVKGLTSGAIKM